MRIFVLFVVVALAVGAPVSLYAAVHHDPCTDTDMDSCRGKCPGDSPEGHCPPVCDYCVCCFAVSPMAVLLTSEFKVIESCESVANDCVDVSESASPIDIFHVPRFLLA